MTIHWSWQKDNASPANAVEPWQKRHSSWSGRVTTIWLAGMFVLLPVEMLKLPFNVTLVDVWVIVGLPLLWLLVPRGEHIISLTYLLPMWLILVGSFASTFVAPSPGNGLIVVMKEIFVYVWFVTITFAVARLDGRDFRRILLVWSAVVFLHGFVIIAQFLSPEFWRFTAEHLGRGIEYEIYRPSGLVPNANGAAFFQLLGFVPLLLAQPSRKMGAILALLLLSTILATGSMGATLALLAGALVALAVLIMRGHLLVVTGNLAKVLIAAFLLGTLLFPIIGQNERYQNHLHEILVGRAGRSSESRFDLWERGINVFLDQNVFLLGVGPENFRVVDGRDNQLHNDFLAFLVERGLISILGLGLFAGLAMTRAIKLFVITHQQPPAGTHLAVVVLLAAMIAAFIYSLTHQIFHNRQLWIVLAFQEAMYFRLLNAGNSLELPSAGMKALRRGPVRFLSAPARPARG